MTARTSWHRYVTKLRHCHPELSTGPFRVTQPNPWTTLVCRSLCTAAALRARRGVVVVLALRVCQLPRNAVNSSPRRRTGQHADYRKTLYVRRATTSSCTTAVYTDARLLGVGGVIR